MIFVLGFGSRLVIKNNLDIGYVYEYKDTQTFIVSNRDGINKLISIFDQYTLNTNKYLDYLCFKKAFTLYDVRDKVGVVSIWIFR